MKYKNDNVRINDSLRDSKIEVKHSDLWIRAETWNSELELTVDEFMELYNEAPEWWFEKNEKVKSESG